MVRIGHRTTREGVTFRSRLEARWAQELDRIGIAWRYEPTTFVDGRVRYTPDFQLAECPIYMEVKPANTRAINAGAITLGSRGLLPGPLIIALGTPEQHRILIASTVPHQEMLASESRWPRGDHYPSLPAAYIAAHVTLEATMPILAATDQEVVSAHLATDENVLPKLERAIEAFQATGERTRKAIAFLGGLLDKHAALPMDAAVEANGIAQRFLRFRHGPVSYGTSVKSLLVEGWRDAVTCRLAYRQLSQEGRDTAEARWGPFRDAEGNDHPLWLLCFPQDELDALDRRAFGMGIGRGIPREVGRDGE